MLKDLPTTLGQTKIVQIQTKTLVGEGSGFVNTYDAVINPYSGCSFGCDYCYASNFTNSNQDKANWGNWVNVKANAVSNMAALRAGALNGKTIYISTVTDPYQPIEAKALVTQGILQIIAKHHPKAKVVIQTRAPLVTRDLPIFQEILLKGGKVQVNMTVTTDSEAIRKNFEVGCPSIPARLKAITQLQEAGIQGCITMTPLLPLKNPRTFIRELQKTGVSRFIIQDFHLNRPSAGKYVAQTDLRATESAAEHFNCPTNQAIDRYKAHYRENFQVIKKLIPNIGIGKAGFAPPF